MTANYKVIYPAAVEPLLSPTNDAEIVFTGYAFSRKIQQYMLDYCFKVYSGIPLSDEITEDPFGEQ